MIANSRCIACNLSKKEEKIRKHSDVWGYRINANVG